MNRRVERRRRVRERPGGRNRLCVGGGLVRDRSQPGGLPAHPLDIGLGEGRE